MILPYTDMAAIFVMWPNSNLFILYFLVLKAFLRNLVTIGLVLSEKNKFKFSCLNDFGSRSRNDPNLEYSCSFINLFSYLHLQIFRLQAEIISEKYTGLSFPYKSLCDQSLPWPKISQGHPGVII